MTMTMPARTSYWTVEAHPGKALRFALDYDPNPAHTMAQANDLLPENTVSGLYLTAIVMPGIVENTPRLLCASDMSVRWFKPLVLKVFPVQLTVKMSHQLIGSRINSFISRVTAIVYHDEGHVLAEILLTVRTKR